VKCAEQARSKHRRSAENIIHDDARTPRLGNFGLIKVEGELFLIFQSRL